MGQKFDPAQALRDVQHFGEEGGVVPAIDPAVTSTFLNPDDMERVFRGELQGCYLYSRHSNPTVMAFGKKLAAMEGMPQAFGVSSGMAAISSALLQLLMGGGHILCSRTVYGGTWALLNNVFPRLGIQTTFVDPMDMEQWRQAIRPDSKVIFTETLSNPLLAAPDLKALSALAKEHSLKLVVDNTFTPALIAPGQLGADVVVYSCTKYISGSSDLIAGAIVSSEEFIGELMDVNQGVVMLQGPVMDARIAYELYTRLDHLPLRMKAHSQAAQHLAERLVEAQVEGLIYPGLKTHPQHELLKSMLHPEYGFGGMMTLDLGSLDRALYLARRLQEEKFGLFAVSLGFTRTLMSCPAASTSSEIPQEEQKAMGLSPGLLRLSLGLCGNHEVMSERFLKCYKETFTNSAPP